MPILIYSTQLDTLQHYPQVSDADKDSLVSTAEQRRKDLSIFHGINFPCEFSSDYLQNEECAQYLSTFLFVISSMDPTSIKGPQQIWPTPGREDEKIDCFVIRARKLIPAFLQAAVAGLLTESMCRAIEHRLWTWEIVTIALWRLSSLRGNSKDIKLLNTRQRPTVDW
jgi:hypothetical protein